MGLAATQARFLGITARKSNIEYEGQQVNQQRTALAEEVNSLYTKLLSLKVPIAPDTTEFYESNYSFEITNTSDMDGEYIIKSYYQNDDGSYYLNTEHTHYKNVAVGTVLKNTTVSDDGRNKTLVTPDGTYTLYESQNSKAMVDLINGTYPNEMDENAQLYYYQDKDGLSHYMDKSLVDRYPDLNPGEELRSYISDSKQVTDNIIFENANIVLDEKGRFKSISARDKDTGKEIFSQTDVDTTRTYDTEGYEAALRDYTMGKDEYDQEVARLNGQTKSLQQEDKVLELRLNQIDTEQSTLQTELEAIKKVLDKNIENTFNTFQ